MESPKRQFVSLREVEDIPDVIYSEVDIYLNSDTVPDWVEDAIELVMEKHFPDDEFEDEYLNVDIPTPVATDSPFFDSHLMLDKVQRIMKHRTHFIKNMPPFVLEVK